MTTKIVINSYPEFGIHMSWVQCCECGMKKRSTGFWIDFGRKALVVHWRVGRCKKCPLPY